ncbi:hypothetical protein ACHAWF_012817 [Thalassiosira exigua]
MTSRLDQYLWIAVTGGIFGFAYCFSIGANDVANAFVSRIARGKGSVNLFRGARLVKALLYEVYLFLHVSHSLRYAAARQTQATSVASKSITLKQAVIIASIFEFCGVLFLGASVASTVRGKIFDAEAYAEEPELVLLGMFTSLVAASVMMMGATYLGLPVSTTHTVIGCIIGFTIAAKGFDSVNWRETTNIFVSWVAAPLLTGAAGFLIFLFIRRGVLLGDDPFRRGYYTFPFVLFATITINLFFIFNKGTKNFTHFQENVYDTKWVVPTCVGIGAVVGLLWLWPIGPAVKRKLEAKREARSVAKVSKIPADPMAMPSSAAFAAVHPAASVRSIVSIGSSIGSHHERRGSQLAEYDPEEGAIRFAINESVKSLKLTIDSETEDAEEGEVDGDGDDTEHAGNLDESRGKVGKRKRKKKNFLVRFEEATYKQNLEAQCFQESRATEQCWQNAAQYDSEVEQLFTYVQVFTASLSSFAHGANDIANAIAPVAAIIDIYQTGQLNPEAPVQKWILAYGGVALSLGLLLYGYKVMKTIGYKLTAVSPTRGSSASLASALIVATASYIGIPVSTTQCIVGAVAGIGLVEGRRNVQWLQLGKCIVGWVVVFFAAAIGSAALFAFCAYSPSLVA